MGDHTVRRALSEDEARLAARLSEAGWSGRRREHGWSFTEVNASGVTLIGGRRVVVADNGRFALVPVVPPTRVDPVILELLSEDEPLT